MDVFRFMQEAAMMLILVAIALALYLRSLLDKQREQHKETRKKNRALAFDVAGLKRAKQRLDNDAADLKQQVQDLEEQVSQLTDDNRSLRYNWNRTNERLLNTESRLQAAEADYEQRYLARQREDWFVLLRGYRCRSRAEIGARVLYPMLRYLGYPYNAFDVDYSIPIRGRNQPQQVYVSYYVFEMVSSAQGRPLFVLQSVEPELGINDGCRNAVDMDTYAIGAAKYGLADDEYFELYRVGADKRPVVRCRISELSRWWDDIRQELAPDAFGVRFPALQNASPSLSQRSSVSPSGRQPSPNS